MWLTVFQEHSGGVLLEDVVLKHVRHRGDLALLQLRELPSQDLHRA